MRMLFPFGAQNHRYWQEHEWEMLALNWLELLFFQMILLLFWLVIKGYCLSYLSSQPFQVGNLSHLIFIKFHSSEEFRVSNRLLSLRTSLCAGKVQSGIPFSGRVA